MAKRKKRPSQGRRAVSLAPIPQKVANRIPRGDMGATGPAMRHGLITEPVTHIDDDGNLKESPNNMRRARRIDIAESYHRRDRPILSDRQFKAAKRLREAYEATMKSPPAIKAVQVDSSPKPDAFIGITIDRISAFSGVMRHVPSDCRDVVAAVVLDNQPIGRLKEYRGRQHEIGVELLQRALDLVADAMCY